MALQITLEPNLVQQYPGIMAGVLGGVRKASSLASRATAKVIQQKGAEDIARSGKFGARWQKGLVVTSVPTTGYSVDNVITMSHSLPGAMNFEYGGVVKGRPLLWIPLSFADPKARARNYPGGLFRVDRKAGKPLLLSIADKRPKFVGVRSVRIPKKWHLRDIANRAMAEDWVPFYNRSLTLTDVS